ncbi:MAG TPA: RraA family protein [Candidatus Sulfotelmatobacter sp.]|nr:RraA family protein [Candidatus Sulfotelmatobacter sp.]
MNVAWPLTEQELDALRQIDSCMVANAVETFHVRLRNTGFTDASVRCIFDDAKPMVGYAMTARLRSGEPPIKGGTYHDRSDFWNSLLKIPPPRILVLQDMDNPPGRGAFIGDVHAAILKALGCVGYVTNGAVRELPAVQKTGIQLFAGNVVVSHAYAHIFDVGASVTLGGMEVKPGALLHGDRHGVLNIPQETAAAIPKVAQALRLSEKRVIEFCQSDSFSISKLSEIIQQCGQTGDSAH